MFQAIIKRAEVAVDRTIDQAVNKTIMLIPFLIGAGFATAALSIRLTSEFGAEARNWIMAGVFGALGLVVAVFLSLRTSPPAPSEGEADELVSSDVQEDTKVADKRVENSELEMLKAALSSMGPATLPHILRFVLRNLPLIAAVVAALAAVFYARARNSEVTPSAEEGGPASA